jgi:hypothetical protein
MVQSVALSIPTLKKVGSNHDKEGTALVVLEQEFAVHACGPSRPNKQSKDAADAQK